MKNVSLTVTALILLASCQKAPKFIRKDLDSRFVKYEIIECRKDISAYDSVLKYANISIRVLDEIESSIRASRQIEIRMENLDNPNYFNKRSTEKTYKSLDSLFKILEYSEPKASKPVKNEPCYFVKYRVWNTTTKDEFKEYYFSKFGETCRRQIDDDLFNASLYPVDFVERLVEMLERRDELKEYMR